MHYSLTIGEWISGATCMYVVNYLVENYASDPAVGLAHPYVYLMSLPCTNQYTDCMGLNSNVATLLHAG